MSIEAIDFLPTSKEIARLSELGIDKQDQSAKTDFSNWFNSEMDQLNQQLKTAETNLEKLATGETNNLHEVMLSLEKAKTSFQLTLQVRNKLLEAYQEIMRMQI